MVFVLSLAGAMINTGVGPASDNNKGNQLDSFFATYSVASLSLTTPDTGLGAPPAPLQDDATASGRYPVGEDPMNDSMIGTNRSKIAVPVADVPTEKICEALAAAAAENGLPVAFLARLIWQESKFRQSAVSPVGAQGVAQFMPRTANAYGLENPFDPLAALPASARFLGELRNTFGNLGLAAAAYNGGAGRVQNWLARRNKLPEETRNYVKIITGELPEKWAAPSNTVDLAAHLPARAPCEGIAGLSRDSDKVTMPVVLAGWVSETIRKAEEAEAAVRVAAAKARLLARAKGSKASRLAAKNKGKYLVAAAPSANSVTSGKPKPGKDDKPGLKIAIVPEDLSAKKKGTKTAAKSGARSFTIASKLDGKNKPAKVAAKIPTKAAKGAGKPIKLADARRR
jgi:hypothetical protein